MLKEMLESVRTDLKLTVGIIAVIAIVITTVGGTNAWAEPQGAGHRGATNVQSYPEESTRALAYAKKYGAAIAEGDVLFTKDDEPIMMHDRTFDRTTACSGRVDSKTFAQMRECAPPSVVPSVLTWMAHVKSHGMIANLEVRSNPVPTERQLDKLIAQIERNFPRELVIASFDPAVLELMRDRLGNRAKYAPIVHARTASGVESLFGYSVNEHASKYDILIADYRWLIVARVRWYHEAGMPVWGYTGKTEWDFTRMRALKVDAIIANDMRDF